MKHPQEGKIIEWLESVKLRKEPLSIEKGITIIDFKKFTSLNIWRLKSKISERIYITTIENVTQAKKAYDRELNTIN